MLIFFVLYFTSTTLSVFVHLGTDSATSPALSLRTTTVEVDNDITCSILYGRPSSSDCSEVLNKVQTFLGSNDAAADAFEQNYYEFVSIGHQARENSIEYSQEISGIYYTPLYWANGQSSHLVFHLYIDPHLFLTGNCVGALFIDRSPGSITTDVDRWQNIHMNGYSLNIACIIGNDMGGYKQHGGRDGGMIFYLFGVDSPFHLLLDMKLRCPACNQGNCFYGSGQQCSNNPQTRENPRPAPDPEIPSSLPQQEGDVHITVPEVCERPCSSQADCHCGDDYRCVQDVSVFARLRPVTMQCIFIPLSAGLHGKRDVKSPDNLMLLLSGCVCNATYTGTECC